MGDIELMVVYHFLLAKLNIKINPTISLINGQIFYLQSNSKNKYVTYIGLIRECFTTGSCILAVLLGILGEYW